LARRAKPREIEQIVGRGGRNDDLRAASNSETFAPNFPDSGTISPMATLAEPDPIFDLLQRSKTIAVVGLSDSPLRPSHGVSAYMQTHGYRIIPVNPMIQVSLGERSYPSLLDVPGKIDIVNIFRRPEFVEQIVDQAIQLKVPAVWMQEEVIHEKAAEKARKSGIFVIMDRCILQEHRARFQ
jgi:predicted CoA-binding protein